MVVGTSGILDTRLSGQGTARPRYECDVGSHESMGSSEEHGP